MGSVAEASFSMAFIGADPVLDDPFVEVVDVELFRVFDLLTPPPPVIGGAKGSSGKETMVGLGVLVGAPRKTSLGIWNL